MTLFFIKIAVLGSAMMMHLVAAQQGGLRFLGGHQQETICHRTTQFKTITVSEAVVDTHLGHGDFEGSCDGYCQVLCDDGDACTVDYSGISCEENGCATFPRGPTDCDDGNECTMDTCDPLSGCQHADIVCTAGETCSTVEGCRITTNLAEDHGVASQSSDWRSSSEADFLGLASNAIDGNTGGDFYEDSVTHTNNEVGAWWEVDLGGVAIIDKVKIYNRSDGSQERLSFFHVELLDAVSQVVESQYFPSFQQLPAATSLDINYFGGISAQYVRVRFDDTYDHVLSLAEVEVYGTCDTCVLPK
jgi:hypothetical protein